MDEQTKLQNVVDDLRKLQTYTAIQSKTLWDMLNADISVLTEMIENLNANTDDGK